MPASSKVQNSSAAYRQIEESLRSRIRLGDWPIGAMLPGRRELAREYGVSPITIERAVTHLLADGTLRSDHRRGTFVAQAPPVEAAPSPAAWASPAVTDHAATQSPRDTRTGATLIIGIIASLYVFNCDHLELNNYLVRTLLDSMESAFAEESTETRFYNRVVAPGRPLLSLEESLAAAVADGVDAIVIIALGLDPAVVDESLTVLGAQDLSIVCITSSALSRPVPHVFYDNYSAGYQAAQHLLRGSQRDLLVLAPFTASWVQERIAGVRSAVEHAKLPKEAVQVVPCITHAWVNEEDPEILGYESGLEVFKAGSAPSCVICVNDGVAFGFVRAAAEFGKKIGEGVMVLGFDNHPRSLGLGITSLRAPMEGMGREAARLLLREVHGEGTGFQVRLRWRLIPRASTRPAS